MAKPPIVDIEIWRHLHDAALTYAQFRPWELLSDQDLFALRSPLSDETLYACTIGQEKISYGLLLYRGEAGYASYRWVAEEGKKDGSDVDEYIARQNQIALEFVPKNQLDKVDRAIIKDLGGAKVKAPVWAKFRTQRPFEPPWYLDENEVVLLTLALVCGVDFIGRIIEGKLSLPMPPDRIPTYEILDSTNGELSKTLPDPTWSAPPIHRPLPAEPLPIDQKRVDEILKSTKLFNEAWEADVCLMKIVIGEGERPFIPLAVLIVDQHSGFILDSHLSEEAGSPHKILAEGILNAMENNQTRPTAFLVKKGPMAARLAPLAKALGIPITETNRLPMLTHARREMNKYFARR